MPLTVEQLIQTLPRVKCPVLPAPIYSPPTISDRVYNLGLAVESMRRHMTDEGWQIFDGLQHAGYELAGHNLATVACTEMGGKQYLDQTDVKSLLIRTMPTTVVVQDKREWDYKKGDFRDPKAQFTNVDALRSAHDVFKVTILKDAQQRPEYHRQSADEMGVHAWIVYYHPKIVKRLAPYVREQHLIRTYHSISLDYAPTIGQIRSANKHGCLLSGAVSGAYPLRSALVRGINHLPETTYLVHPGYHRDGCATPKFLQVLCNYKVAICTASMYGYALRKIMEATACGCRVITDLPNDEILPAIDGNLIRVLPGITAKAMAHIIEKAIRQYDLNLQLEFAQKAQDFYDYQAVGRRLAADIESMRLSFNGN